ncbi:MAG: hypothetical protein BWY95_01497 [Bacteroidetes bacterium ADurb.BinA104]|nr:MAG: hypothetical protein BWY95_01497 [Bacteroidetes bacterium ADurb.BinA104]
MVSIQVTEHISATIRTVVDSTKSPSFIRGWWKVMGPLGFKSQVIKAEVGCVVVLIESAEHVGVTVFHKLEGTH